MKHIAVHFSPVAVALIDVEGKNSGSYLTFPMRSFTVLCPIPRYNHYRCRCPLVHKYNWSKRYTLGISASLEIKRFFSALDFCHRLYTSPTCSPSTEAIFIQVERLWWRQNVVLLKTLAQIGRMRGNNIRAHSVPTQSLESSSASKI